MLYPVYSVVFTWHLGFAIISPGSDKLVVPQESRNPQALKWCITVNEIQIFCYAKGK